VDDAASLQAALGRCGLPAVLKTRRQGYDGRGQAVVRTAAEAESSRAALGESALILEAFVPFERELSVLAVRGADGASAVWPVVQNEHREGILRVSRAPADDPPPGATEAVLALAHELDYVGVLALELFDVGGRVLANEFAPRVHNSGHWTIEGAVTSQFENHLRAVLELPLGSTAAVAPSAMVNLIGTVPDLRRLLAIPGAHVHLYGKAPRPGRKLGHVTLVGDAVDRLDEVLALS
jgi:5-(carboxyamino)imidazole ribonucleotide synthase